ncbi:hypothetical protein Acr_00g0078100 [Actinidia rufa]|uniref:CCHC-type domain-containing protein n=1 Tax=Actinidia rufa TaxID=165716 RepID=A0A7J0DTG0_9ERIC|nr:hypothetical protein Acr_00g0078100 [Actinidia rufa]
MLSNPRLGRQYWDEIVMYACHLHMRLPSASLEDKTPIEVWLGRPTNDYDSMHVFGFPAYYHVRDSKLDPRAKKALFLGFSTGVKCYNFCCLDSKKVVLSCNVIFDELEMLKLKVQVPESSFGTPQPVEFETSMVSQGVNEFESKVGEDGGSSGEFEALVVSSLQRHDSITTSRPRRISESMLESGEWKKAVDEEINSLQKNQTWIWPNSMQVVTMVSRYMHDLDRVYWQATRWILRYILGTMDIGLKFKKSDRIDHFVFRYVDSNYAGEVLQLAVWFTVVMILDVEAFLVVESFAGMVACAITSRLISIDYVDLGWGCDSLVSEQWFKAKKEMADEESSVSARGVGQEEPERVQHQPDATDRLAALMAQYMEFQMARPVRGTTLHEQFMKLNPPEFVGAIDPLVAEEWLKKLDAIFEVMEVTDEHKLILATFMLRGEARRLNWWESMRRMQNAQPEGVSMSWQRFVDIFNDQYFPRIYRMQKEQEFMSLKKGAMSVVEFEEKFTALSRFAPEMVRTEDMKCRRFEQGLDLQIRSRVAMFEINIYSDLVNKARIAEREVMELQNRREQFKRRRFDQGAGTSRQSTMVEQSGAQTSAGSARPSGSRSAGRSRGRGSWRPSAGPVPTRSDNTRGIVCYRCGVEGHRIRDCPMSWVDKCYQCGQPGHIARHCTQEPIAASSVGSAVGRGIVKPLLMQ